MPELAQKCIASWRKYLPDYEIRQWDESNFDVNIIPYTQEAYRLKKYAFVSDYARFWILYRFGGLYFDTDVEVIRPLDDIIEKGPFMGIENSLPGATPLGVAPGLGLGVNPGLGLYKKLLDIYAGERFTFDPVTRNNKTVVMYTTELLRTLGFKDEQKIQFIDGVYIYPKDYFCPVHPAAFDCFTENTRSIHHYAASWIGEKGWKTWVRRILGHKNSLRLMLLKQKLKGKCQ